MMKTDVQIQQDVLEQLKWEPFLCGVEINVSVKNGVVALSGDVDSYAKKLSAQNAAKKIEGVKAVADEIEIVVSANHQKSDTAITEAVINALKWHAAIKEEKVLVAVEDGNVKLEGAVEWEFERNMVQKAIESLTGVRSVINCITVVPAILPEEIECKINAAFHRSATIDAARIRAEVNGNVVILHGRVRSIAEKEDAENAAWNAPGVTIVDNKLIVDLHFHDHIYVD